MSAPVVLNVLLLIAGFGALSAACRFGRERGRLRHILEHSLASMSEGFVLYDDRDRLVMWNEQAKRMHSPRAQAAGPGTSFETILRLEVEDGHFTDATGQEEAWIARRLAGHRAARSVPEECLSNGRCIRITKDRTPDGYIVSLIVDVTEMRDAQRAAEAGDRAKADLLKNISHELRTPLTVILGHAKMLSQVGQVPATRSLRETLGQGDAPGELFRSALEGCLGNIAYQGQRIVSSSHHLLNLVNEILDLARVEAGKVELDIEPIEADEVLGEAVEDFRQVADERGVELICRLRTDLICADRHRLKQIVYNLLGNALKFTDAGWIAVEAHPARGGTWLAVEDTGMGIAEDQLGRIFESFHQVDASDARPQQGSGLGLALTKGLVEQHGGTIGVTSRVGYGSRFTIFLPHHEAALSELQDVDEELLVSA